MKRFLIATCAAAGCAAVWGAPPPSYSLSIPGAPIVRLTTSTADNAWLASNCVASVSASFANAAPSAPISVSGTPGLSRYTLAASEAGFSVERIKPEVWLGDMILPPEGMVVDWAETYAIYSTNVAEQTQFIFDNIGKRVFAQSGGTLTFSWAAVDGSVTPRVYIASGATQGRPYKLFWTDGNWQGPVIDLSGKFVKLFGPSHLITPEYGNRVETTGGHMTTQQNVVIYGVYLDRSSSGASLYAYDGGRNTLSGQFILAYYDTGAFDNLKHLQVIEVAQPDIADMVGYIGEAIKPHGSGHVTQGLRPQPVTTAAAATEDEYGPYYYQHRGNYSYSPKNNNVYPLRETTDAPWRLDVYWMEDDAYGVSWPFERCQYACSWNTNAMPVLVAGDTMKIPDAYNAELCKYQIPNGHAQAPQENRFSVTAPNTAEPQTVGYSCLKLTTTDNVWFVPVRTVARMNTDFFTLEAEPWLIGDELVPRGGSVSGTRAAYRPAIDTSVPGLIDHAHSGSHYNPELYYDWTTSSNSVPSVIYAVNTSPEGKALEVHWSMSVQQPDMPAKLSFPCLAQRYMIEYPEPDEVPQIVIASQKGGSDACVYRTGDALYFDSAATTAQLPPARLFRTNEAAIAFWANAAEAAEGTGRILTLGQGDVGMSVEAAVADGTVTYALTVSASGTTATLVTPAVSTTAWHRVTFCLVGTNATAYVDGAMAVQRTWPEIDLSGYFIHNVLGAVAAAAAPRGLALDNLTAGVDVVTEAQEHTRMYAVPDTADSSLGLCCTFSDEDLTPQFGSTSTRLFTEEISGRVCEITDALRFSPGAPRAGDGVFQSDSTPLIYRQPNASLPGYNPNEEHAFIASGSGGYFAWALRCDLNTEKTSKPGVLVQYTQKGRPAMKYFAVLLTNETYTALAATATVGTVLPGPHPLDTFANPWCVQDYWDAVPGQAVSPAFPDRKNQVWSRCAGMLPIHMYYPNQDGFDFPGATVVPSVGTPIPWLSCLNGFSETAMLLGSPATWTWNVEWPKNVENMRIGQTLTIAADGLPEVWNCKSVAVVYPDDGGKTALLWDPTVIRKATASASLLSASGAATPAALLAYFGFDPAAGNVTLRGGKYTFKDLPPSVGDRFFADATLAVSSCLCFKGERATNAGGSILYPNVLNAGEMDALKGLVPSGVGATKKAQWDALVDTLPLTPIEPSRLTVETDGTGKAHVDYQAKDHYALTAMGATNYVVIIENDATNEVMHVEDGDAVSMHVFKVLPDYYAGRVVTREDPLNLLSQQLAILYTESFAGKADDYEFEWKKAVPALDGAMPTDYTNVYKDVFAESDWSGLTRFTIGQQGDTLANLVNTYYVMRYRAKPGTAPYEVMGSAWSDWCGPALAEGWIQRCVNNVTPFTQRMRDLYENTDETTVSMIAQAGKPWTGDVALNQDNLTSVGLIELYQTLLNKAESMSLTVGLNNADANKQLLLAAERLCDLYVLLGNEAYVDALNPTIGFGTEWATVAAGTTPIEFGAESTGLFCFDNQVPSLLDEELALLRGRTGANNPSVTTAPFYNRLVWNFTRGITAGEVAYAVNYNINSLNNDATLNENDAALLYPQGHGDAWGHYLSAMSVWYRLLRNPSFSWTASQMQMNVADSVVDVDYFDEERFAETAGKLAKTAIDIMDRTAKKAWRDNGGAKGAGYLDGDTERNFGYGEWATRGGIGGVMNWMVANSLLPAAETSREYFVAALEKFTMISITNAPLSAAEGPWTFEFGLSASPEAAGEVFAMYGDLVDDLEYEPPSSSEDWLGSSGAITLTANGDGSLTLLAGVDDFYLACVTNVEFRTVTNITYGAADPLVVTGTNIEENVRVESIEYFLDQNDRLVVETSFDIPSNALVSVACDATGALSVRVLSETGAVVKEAAIGRLPMDSPFIMFGGDTFTGAVGEMRMWKGSRTSAELQAARAYVNPREANLVAYTRGISTSKSVDELPDETPGGLHPWEISGPAWTTIERSGLDVAFEDDGLLRINRSTAADLATIPNSVSTLQRKLDQLDGGMNPLGHSDGAVPFDIIPGDGEGDSDDAHSHFEQIAERAKKALNNAVKILDRAQTATAQLRHASTGQAAQEEERQISEADYTKQLIEIYGMPYSDDIGPSGTYPQGYEGPDLYHYMYMDLSLFGVTGAENLKPVAVATYDASKGWTYESMKSFMENTKNNATTATYSYQLSANGLVVKPDSFTGARLACGKIQDAYTAYILAWIDWMNAYNAYSGKLDRLSVVKTQIETVLAANSNAYSSAESKYSGTRDSLVTKIVFQQVKNAFDASVSLMDDAGKLQGDVTKTAYIGMGLSVLVNPLAPIMAAAGGVTLTIGKVFKALSVSAQSAIDVCDNAIALYDNAASWAEAKAGWTDAQKAAFDETRDAIADLGDAARDMKSAWAKMVAEAENFDTIAAEGDRIQSERAAARAKRVNHIIGLRYNDMFFRLMQNEALTRYSQAFDLAQKYVYMAAQTYDYETGLLSADRNSGDAFRAEIIGARTLGKFTDDGDPLPGTSSRGDPGLADILYRMQANYDVLKGRLGINNPDKNTTWFSLRKELFRISSETNALADWRLELAKHVVPDIREVPEYKRFCQSMASSSALLPKEPAIVIPFESSIDFAKNFFGRDLAAGDHALDSSYFATKINAVGVKFDKYPADALSTTPVVYLIPAGQDKMRVPGGGENGSILYWNVADQVIPIPYTIGSAELDSADWQPLYTGDTGGVDLMAKIRRIPSFRAIIDDPKDEAEPTSRRLVGRSAWNTRWVMIIPAGSLLGGNAEDREKALSIFINGQDTDRDGLIDVPGVDDILLGFKTYATSGN